MAVIVERHSKWYFSDYGVYGPAVTTPVTGRGRMPLRTLVFETMAHYRPEVFTDTTRAGIHFHGGGREELLRIRADIEEPGDLCYAQMDDRGLTIAGTLGQAAAIAAHLRRHIPADTPLRMVTRGAECDLMPGVTVDTITAALTPADILADAAR
ncbi:hypothetical protein OG225_19595 [Nocardia sp. NBC_01377]|uniref:hypothetical protein n=1 Tax=Nocardia sp. NBC_01377 TaxID=2903595 RepID=UPI0032568668